ncbi:MAG TPA: glycosyltransferase family 4 protein [Kiritimatiellia bacterium]|nr:glycosyltransferase family 4 protein [Kiritimatiellia bacterium]
MTTRLLAFMSTGFPAGGVATWLDHAHIHLPPKGYDLAVALVRGERHNRPENIRPFHPEWSTIDVDGRGLDPAGRIRACHRLIRHVRPDLVLPMGVLDANPAAMIAARDGLDLRVIGRAQGQLPPMLADLEDLRDGLDHLVCVGALTRAYLVAHAGFDPHRIDHIPNGAAEPTTPRKMPDPKSPIRLAYIGRLTQPDKRVLDLPGICRELNARSVNYHLTIVGDGPEATTLRHHLAPFAARITFTGPLPGPEVYRSIYPSLDALLLLSATETFGIVLAEAMMNGVVPITSRYLGFHLEGLVPENQCGLAFPIGDVQTAAQAVQTLADHPDRRAALSHAARLHAHANYRWPRCFEAWHPILQQSLHREPRRALPPRVLPTTAVAGRLDRLRLPPALIDHARRLRRKLAGPTLPPGGEEWPLYRTHHHPERLAAIEARCLALDQTAPPA